jgi:hypothetical protein
MKRCGPHPQTSTADVRCRVQQNVPTAEQIEDEARRIGRVRLIVDFTACLIMQGALGRNEAEALVGLARRKVLDLFPGAEGTFQIVYAPRFRRLVDEFARPAAPAKATVIPFPEDPRF